jgi:hypothetical protein
LLVEDGHILVSTPEKMYRSTETKNTRPYDNNGVFLVWGYRLAHVGGLSIGKGRTSFHEIRLLVFLLEYNFNFNRPLSYLAGSINACTIISLIGARVLPTFYQVAPADVLDFFRLVGNFKSSKQAIELDKFFNKTRLHTRSGVAGGPLLGGNAGTTCESMDVR